MKKIHFSFLHATCTCCFTYDYYICVPHVMQGIVRMLLVATVDQYFIFDGARELDRKRYLVLNKSATSRVMYAYCTSTLLEK